MKRLIVVLAIAVTGCKNVNTDSSRGKYVITWTEGKYRDWDYCDAYIVDTLGCIKFTDKCCNRPHVVCGSFTIEETF